MKIARGVAVCMGVSLLLGACSGGASDVPATKTGSKTCQDVDLASSPKEPVTIRIGHGAAAEEPFWLMSVDKATNKYAGKWYDMKLSPFRGTAERLTAFQAGDLDTIVISPQAQIIGTARGALELYTIATIMRDADSKAFSTSVVALEKSGIDGVKDLKGKTIAIIDEGSQPDFVVRQGLQDAGLDPARDGKFVVLPFPSQEEALRGGQIDVAVLPEPFYTLAMSKGGIKKVYDAADITEFSYDLLTMSFRKTFVEKNIGAVCAWAADFGSSMDVYKSDPAVAKKKLIGTPFITLPESVYLKTSDYARPAGGVVDPKGTEQMMETMIKFGIIKKSDRIDVSTLIRPGVSIGH